MYRAFSNSKSNNAYKIIAIVITLCLHGGCSKRAESHNLSDEARSTSISQALSISENLFSARQDISKLREAVRILGVARDPNKRNYEVEWKFAKYSYFLGKVEPIEKDAIEVFEKGKDAGRIASRVSPNTPEGHFWFGANLGELSRISPITVGIKSVDDIRESMNKVIELEPGFQGASAFDALGQLEMATRTLKGGKTEKAVEYYERGLELAPDNANIRLHLAEAYLALKKDAEARRELNALFSMTPNPEYATEHQAAVAKGRSLFEKNF